MWVFVMGAVGAGVLCRATLLFSMRMAGDQQAS